MFKDNGTLVIESTKINDRGEYVCIVLTTGFEPVISKPATISVIGNFVFHLNFNGRFIKKQTFSLNRNSEVCPTSGQ